jgi:cell division protein FtsB
LEAELMNINILKSKIFSIAAVIVLGSLFLSAVKVNTNKGLLEERLSDLREKAEKIENENENIQKEIDSAGNPEYLEKQARIKLNYRAPGEEVAFIYNREEAVASFSAEGVEKEESSNIEKWWRWLWSE